MHWFRRLSALLIIAGVWLILSSLHDLAHWLYGHARDLGVMQGKAIVGLLLAWLGVGGLEASWLSGR